MRDTGMQKPIVATGAVAVACLFISLTAIDSAYGNGTEHGRIISISELDAMASAFLAPLPATGEIELFSTFTRPPISFEEAEKRSQKIVDDSKARREPYDEAGWKAMLKANIDGLMQWYSTPALEHERFLFRNDARHLDCTSSAAVPLLTPDTPFLNTYIEPGAIRDRDGRSYKYSHWNRLPNNEKKEAGYACLSEKPGTAAHIRDIREELIGIERLLLEIFAVEVCDLPKLPLKRAPEARELPLNPQKIQNLLADKGNVQIRVSEFDVDGEKRLRIRFLLPKGWGLLTAKELPLCAEIVVKAADFRAVYEQRLFDTEGNETVVVTADGFDDQGIPKEKTWVKRLPDGQHETTAYAILNAKINIEIPAAEFEFHPPEGYRVYVMGPDGRPIKTEGDAPPPPQLEKKPVANRLWGLNVLAVLVLAAFTIRKLLLRRQSDAGGGATP